MPLWRHCAGLNDEGNWVMSGIIEEDGRKKSATVPAPDDWYDHVPVEPVPEPVINDYDEAKMCHHQSV